MTGQLFLNPGGSGTEIQNFSLVFLVKHEVRNGTYLGLGPGGMERMIFYPAMFWALSYGAYMLVEKNGACTS